MAGNPILVILTVSYFDDIGSMSKSSISEKALAAFPDFRLILAVILKGEKSGLCRKLTFLGWEGRFPSPR